MKLLERSCGCNCFYFLIVFTVTNQEYCVLYKTNRSIFLLDFNILFVTQGRIHAVYVTHTWQILVKNLSSKNVLCFLYIRFTKALKHMVSVGLIGPKNQK